MQSKLNELKNKKVRTEDEIRNLENDIRKKTVTIADETRRNRQEKFDLTMKEQKLEREKEEMRQLKFRDEQFKESLNQITRDSEIAEREEEREKQRARRQPQE
ncbi:MAG: hypothetical protein PHV93_00290 [Candidatus Pacebacteria bacterium]|nr:hypothetical protein [Candidatus Paceibacterota bacterium]